MLPMPKKHRRQEHEPEIIWEKHETPDAEERLAKAFKMLLLDSPHTDKQEADSE
jgi:hypothetical protein